MRQKMVCFPFAGPRTYPRKWSNAVWKIYAAGPSNRDITFVCSTSLVMASKREIYESEKRTELSQTTASLFFSPDQACVEAYWARGQDLQALWPMKLCHTLYLPGLCGRTEEHAAGRSLPKAPLFRRLANADTCPNCSHSVLGGTFIRVRA